MPHLYYPRCETLNCWRSFDAHFQDRAGSVSLLLWSIKEANTSVMTICNKCLLWLPRMQDLKLLTLCWHTFPGWGKERLSAYFDQKASQCFQKDHWRTIVNIWWLTVGYQNATINSTTQNAKLEIGPKGSRQTWPNPPADGYVAGFRLPRGCGSGSWMV